LSRRSGREINKHEVIQEKRVPEETTFTKPLR
jgi:hypothetical protein